MSGEVRSVVVRLSASVAGYIGGMGKADAATAKVERGLERLNKKTLSTDQTMSRIGKAGAVLFLGAAAGIAVAEKKAADFNSEMATVYTLSHANTRQQELLAKAAKTVGVNIGYSATQSASAEEELIKAGVKLKDIMGGGLKGALDLAAAGQTDVGSATEVAASAMTQFNLKGKDVPHIADLLAAGADKALGSVTDLGYGLSQTGTQAHQMGFSIEETVGTLAEFAQSGLLGEKGGSTLKQMFLQLAAPTEKAQKLMDRYGVSLYDANGQIKTMPQLADNLQRSFSTLDPATRNYALGVIFGSRAIQGANILIKDGEKKNRAWIKSVNDQGFAAHQASGKMDSLTGDLKKLDAQLGNAFIDQGGKQGFLRGMVQDATTLVKKYNELSDTQKSLLGKGVVGAAAVGGALWTANKVYKIATSTAEVYRALFKTRAATSAVEAVAGGGLGKKSGVVPVYVTNWGKGGIPGAGGAGGGPTVIGGEPARGRRGLVSKAASGGLIAIEVAMGAALAQQAQDAIGQIGSRGKENGILSAFDKPRSTKSSLLAGGTSHSVAHDTKAASGAQKFGGLFSGIDTKLAGLIGGDGLSKSIKNVKELDSALSKVATADQTKGWADYNKILNKSGLSAEQLNKVLPKTARSLTQGGKATGDMGSMLRQTVPQLAKMDRQLQSLPPAVRTKISTPGFEPSSANIRQLKKQYDLTPKQLRTLVRLLGGPAAIAAANAVDARLNRLNGKTVKTFIRTITTHENAGGGAGPKKNGLSGLVNSGGFARGGYTGAGPKYKPAGVVHADEFVFSKEATRGNVGYLDALHRGLRGYASGGAVSAVSGGTGTRSVTVTFPAPKVYAAAVKAADDIAAAAVKTTATAKDLRAVHLDDLHQQQSIRDLQKSLNEHNKKTVGKGKNRHTVKTGFTLTGLDRKTAKSELADAKATLVEMRKQSDVAKALADARQEAREAQQQARTDAQSTITGGFDLLSRGPAGAAAYTDRYAADVAKFGNVIARLRGAKASPMLLQKMVDLANSGDFRTATRFGQSLLDQPALLTQLNTSLTAFGQVAGGVANLTTDPRFLTSAAWNPTSQVANVQQVQVLLAADPSTWMTQLVEKTAFVVQARLGAGGK